MTTKTASLDKGSADEIVNTSSPQAAVEAAGVDQLSERNNSASAPRPATDGPASGEDRRRWNRALEIDDGAKATVTSVDADDDDDEAVRVLRQSSAGCRTDREVTPRSDAGDRDHVGGGGGGGVDRRPDRSDGGDGDGAGGGDAGGEAEGDEIRMLLRRRRRRVVAVYVATLIFLYADMNLLAPNLTAVARDFGLDDQQRDVWLGGYISLAFFLVGAPASFLIGWLADSVPRRNFLFAASVFVGEAACFATFFVQSFAGLFVTRTLTGVSIGGSLPVTYSVLGDLYGSNERNAIAAVVSTGTGIGIGVGQALAGFLGPTLGWRFPFLIVSVPAFLCGFLLLRTDEPKRGEKEFATLATETASEGQQNSMGSELLLRDGDTTAHDDLDQTHDAATPVAFGPDDDASYVERYRVGGHSNGEECQDRARCSPELHPARSKDKRFVATDRQAQQTERSESEREHELPVDRMRDGEGVVVGNDDGDGMKCSHNQSSRGKNGNIMPEEVKRSTEEVGGEAKEEVTWKSTFAMCKTPTVVLTLLQGAPNVIPFSIAATFLNDYLAQDRGMSVEAATGVLLVFGAGNAVGVIISGVVGHFVYKKDVRLPPVVMGVSVLLSCVPMWYMINRVEGKYTNTALTAFISIVLGVLTIVPIPIERAILANVTLPETRGRANAFLGIIDDLGKGLGPFIVSQLIVGLGSRQVAFNVSLLGWLIGGVISLLMVFTVKHDEESVQDIMRERFRQETGQPSEPYPAMELVLES